MQRKWFVLFVMITLAMAQFACNIGAQPSSVNPQSPGNSDTPPAASTQAPAPAIQGGQISICSLLTADEVSSILGSPVEGHARTGGEAGARFVNCEYYASATNTLTVQGGNADQEKELIMAGMNSILSAQPDSAKQQLVDQVKAQMATQSPYDMFTQLTSVYEFGGYTLTPLSGVGDSGIWFWHEQYHIAIADGSTGGQEFIDLAWIVATDEQTARDKLIPVANAALNRMPIGAQVAP